MNEEKPWFGHKHLFHRALTDLLGDFSRTHGLTNSKDATIRRCAEMLFAEMTAVPKKTGAAERPS